MDGLPEGVNGAFTVSDRNLEAWGREEEEIYRTAVANMRLDGKLVFEDMEEILRRMMPGPVPDFADVAPKFRIYVLTNCGKVFGASELLDGSTLKGIGDKLGSDFVVLPSSLHESIIVPADGSVSYQELASIVQCVNVESVAMEERLSAHVYLYERKEGALRIAA